MLLNTSDIETGICIDKKVLLRMYLGYRDRNYLGKKVLVSTLLDIRGKKDVSRIFFQRQKKRPPC